MDIVLDDKSKKWIESKGSHLTIKNLGARPCCVPVIEEVTTEPRKPKHVEHYHLFNVDNLSIYVHKNVWKKEKLILKLSGFGIFKSISAKFQ
ncbi:MAG TPA: CC/Se motif family (seleno)protein [Chondromyces sp.]|nr:CC/Se motif family (seleno)protein [Chondromyces sp.]